MGYDKMILRMVNADQLLKEIFYHYPLNTVNISALRFFFSNPYQRALIVDRNGRVQFLDPYSEEALGLRPGEAKDRPVSEILPDSSLPRVLRTGEPITGRLFRVGQKEMISAAYPLITDGELLGAVGRVLFRSIEEFEAVYREVQRERGKKQHSFKFISDEYRARYTFKDVIFQSEAMKCVIETAKKASRLGKDVLIVGETGTGKELLAHSIHNEGAFRMC
ncbi:MAG: sigma 54-interacting transcriptional regulator [Deltaproteobacteria bacterium]|nr:sigma 54-interacting transcriptional regulator [Deltaproteobacteria bacterium]